MSERVIPLTPAGPLWSQREYVACMQMGIGFAAHAHGVSQAFHYKFPDPANCCTTVIVTPVSIDGYIDHDFAPGIDWLDRCSAAIRP